MRRPGGRQGIGPAGWEAALPPNNAPPRRRSCVVSCQIFAFAVGARATSMRQPCEAAQDAATIRGTWPPKALRATGLLRPSPSARVDGLEPARHQVPLDVLRLAGTRRCAAFDELLGAVE